MPTEARRGEWLRLLDGADYDAARWMTASSWDILREQPVADRRTHAEV